MSKTKTDTSGFSAEEKAAMKQRAKELKASENAADAENAALEAIAAMPEPERSRATRIHEIIKANAPDLLPKTWYGMPAYARDGKVVCHYQEATKFGTRYGSLGFSDLANLDDGNVWPVAYAIKDLSAADEAKIVALVKKAAS